MIHFNKIRYKNILSTGSVYHEINFNENPTTLIIGENGSGKSTLLDALCFGLFGKPFRKINKPQLVNSINEKNLMVQIQFNIGKTEYAVKRGIKPNVFEIYKNKKMIDQSSKSRDYQKYLEESILGFNFKSFTQIVILGASSFIPFMQLSASDRRNIVEELLDIEIFSVMNILSKTKLSSIRDGILEADYKIKLAKEKISMQMKHMDDIKRNNKQLVAKCRKDIVESQDYITGLKVKNEKHQKDIGVFRGKIGDETSVTKNLDEMKTFGRQISSNIKKNKKEKKFFETKDDCPTCLQHIEDAFKTDMISTKEEKLEQLQSGLEALKVEEQNLLDRWKEIEAVHERVSKLQGSMMKNTGIISTTLDVISKVQDEIESLQGMSLDKSADLNTLKQDRDTFEATKKELIEDKHYNEIVLNLLKDSGIKSMIVKQYLPVMNKLVNKYLAEMDFFVKFELDENFTEVLKSRYRDDFSYANFSEGEKQRIDIALLLTWRSVAKMRNSTNTNLLIFDEVFDASMDASGCEELIKMLHAISQDTNIFIISHKTDILSDKFDNTIRFQKHKNFSRMVTT